MKNQYKKIIKWLRVKSVKREVVRECEREAIKNDFEAELNKQPVADLEKGIHEIKLHIKDLEHQAAQYDAEAERTEADETLEPKDRYEVVKSIKEKAKEHRNEIPNQEKLIESYNQAIKQFKQVTAQKMKVAGALRIKAEYIRTTY